ncbi:AraC family transcriptional regulator [Phreatobacter stygius]|uniref:AraC family transcriptional regulator n=1 Tax=Phreatobacter stygius TaxID=1940610 RepID=A0A4D7BB97_9HYPH|nr:AraC family transcriptional regulator [Phreatobacter stygius]QCI68035.1 AraC family transcriptional regulator [Phreatobacter stygius]
MPRVDTRNSARFWHVPATAGLSCLAADFTTHEYAPHSHPAFVIAVTEAGGSEFKSRGRTEEARSSMLLVFNPDEPHSGRMGRSERWSYRGLYLTSPAIDAVKRALQLERTPYFMENMFGDQDLIAGFRALHHALDGGHDGLEQNELLVDSLGELFRRHGAGVVRLPAGMRDQAKIRAVQQMMRERHDQDLSLDDMAAEVDLSPFQLIGLFKRTTGLTPHAFLTQLRLHVAIAALDRGVAIVEAALAAGFYDQSALTRNFKRCYGITPLQWVRAARG